MAHRLFPSQFFRNLFIFSAIFVGCLPLNVSAQVRSIDRYGGTIVLPGSDPKSFNDIPFEIHSVDFNFFLLYFLIL